jgi:hypothetical protein
MPCPPIDLDPFRNEIEQRLSRHHTQAQIRTWLAGRGIQISKNTLSARVIAWEASRHSRTEDSNPALLAAIQSEFFTTHHDDQEIAQAITAQGLHTTPNQIKRIYSHAAATLLPKRWHRSP